MQGTAMLHLSLCKPCIQLSFLCSERCTATRLFLEELHLQGTDHLPLPHCCMPHCKYRVQSCTLCRKSPGLATAKGTPFRLLLQDDSLLPCEHQPLLIQFALPRCLSFAEALLRPFVGTSVLLQRSGKALLHLLQSGFRSCRECLQAHLLLSTGCLQLAHPPLKHLRIWVGPCRSMGMTAADQSSHVLKLLLCSCPSCLFCCQTRLHVGKARLHIVAMATAGPSPFATTAAAPGSFCFASSALLQSQ
mmetsp:Transcript_77610/g.179986  ORF Transcript_77610/g.179986 Transcript_77610/m.179986 type:complete len:247 (-) Transcript_77610:418-1158(-)